MKKRFKGDEQKRTLMKVMKEVEQLKELQLNQKKVGLVLV